MTIRLILADDHPLVLRGIGEYLSSMRSLEVVAHCDDGGQALAAIRQHRPDVAVLDLSMPVADGLQVLAAVTAEQIPTRIILLSAVIASQQVMTAMGEGAWGILLKDCAPEDLLHCVEEVAAGRKCLPFALFQRLHEQEIRINPIPVAELLTQREWNVAALAARGLSNKEIAHRLKIAERTAKIHLHHVFKKLSINNRTALAHVSFRHADQPFAAGSTAKAGAMSAPNEAAILANLAKPTR
jgi:DNA-binding NarL/FixJ family response regulator